MWLGWVYLPAGDAMHPVLKIKGSGTETGVVWSGVQVHRGGGGIGLHVYGSSLHMFGLIRR